MFYHVLRRIKTLQKKKNPEQGFHKLCIRGLMTSIYPNYKTKTQKPSRGHGKITSTGGFYWKRRSSMHKYVGMMVAE